MWKFKEWFKAIFALPPEPEDKPYVYPASAPPRPLPQNLPTLYDKVEPQEPSVVEPEVRLPMPEKRPLSAGPRVVDGTRRGKP